MYTERDSLAAGRNASSIDVFGVEIHYSQLDTVKSASGQADKRHQFELIYVETGVIQHVTESHRADPRPENVFFIPPNSPRCQVCPSQQATWSLHFSLDAVDGHFRVLLAPHR